VDSRGEFDTLPAGWSCHTLVPPWILRAVSEVRLLRDNHTRCGAVAFQARHAASGRIGRASSRNHSSFVENHSQPIPNRPANKLYRCFTSSVSSGSDYTPVPYLNITFRLTKRGLYVTHYGGIAVGASERLGECLQVTRYCRRLRDCNLTPPAGLPDSLRLGISFLRHFQASDPIIRGVAC
jgi:hypothetical protein